NVLLNLVTGPVPIGAVLTKLFSGIIGLLSNPIGIAVVAIAGFAAAVLLAITALNLFAPKLTETQKQIVKDNNLDAYFDTDNPESRLTSGQQQLLNYFQDQDKNIKNLQEFGRSQGLTGVATDFVADIKPLTAQQEVVFNNREEIKNLREQVRISEERKQEIVEDAKTKGASSQEIKELTNTTSYKNLERDSQKARNALAVAVGAFEIGERPEIKKKVGDINSQIAAKKQELNRRNEEYQKSSTKSTSIAMAFSAGGFMDGSGSFVAQ
ncbi:MAG: hypothetical protein ACKO2Z_10115, partial [Sphaerospermopsis kisseleviana]